MEGSTLIAKNINQEGRICVLIWLPEREVLCFPEAETYFGRNGFFISGGHEVLTILCTVSPME
jgi:hypothetical protein